VEHLLRATAKAEARHFWFRGFRAFVTPLLRQAAAGSTRRRLLDCGCGTGANLALLERFGTAFGVDLSDVGLRIGREAGRRGLARASVAAMPFRAASFDIVTSFDVLYALDEGAERAAMSEMYRVLRPGGFAVVNVAAAESLRGDHSILSHEIRRYSRATLAAGLEAAGFSIVRLTYTNATLFVPLLIARTMQRRRGLRAERESTREITVPPAPVNLAMSALMWMESAWLRWFDEPFGSSLLCLARKPVDAARP
jgi:ubiquinone/menaquinone biosynthesis C-methylase UbiE